MRLTSGCQFNVHEDELEEFGPRSWRWCRFHLPLKSGDGESQKAYWDESRVSAFNKAIFASIDSAKEAGREADLSGVEFPANISFHDYRGEENGLPRVLFLQATFGGDASFSEVTAGSRACFDGTTFYQDAFFESATFAAVSSFRNATFNGIARFKDTRFDREAGFHGTTFYLLVDFERASFKQGVTFDEATFGGEANFENAAFAGNAKFFGDPTREGPAGRADAFRRSVTFRGARFNKRAVFTSRRFLDSTDFSEVTFAVAPEFHNCTLHQGTDFSGAQFMDRKGSEDVDAAMAYRTLKLAMARVRATDEEARFYGYEQQSMRARKDTPRSVKLVSWLYEKTADYGQSFVRPLIWLIGTFVLFCLVYSAALIGPTTSWAEIESVLPFALRQIFHPFWAFRTEALVSTGSEEAVPLWLASVAAVHSLLTFSFLALFLLALRRRFRLT